MRRGAATLALALLVLGCGPSDAEVQILTAPQDHTGCFAADAAGLLVVDPTYGTAIIGDGHENMLVGGDVPVIVAWPAGFSARRSGSEVEVLDAPGNVVVGVTGRSYHFLGGYVAAGVVFGIVWPELKKSVLLSCGPPDLLP